MKLIFFICVLLVTVTSHAQSLAPQGITLQGRIIKPDSTPLEAASVSFTIEVRSPDPDDCLLYTETQTQVMTGSSGIFSFSIGSGSRSGTNFENVSTLAQVFNNASGVISPLVCTSGATSYTPASTHKRKVRLSFDDGSGPQLISQAMDVQSVPYALYADTLQGKPASGYLQVNTASGKALSQANLESVFQSSSYVTELLSLIAGTSTQYASSGGGGGNFNFGTGKLYVDGTSGNVGVGTATPSTRLQIVANSNGNGTPVLISRTANTDAIQIGFAPAGTWNSSNPAWYTGVSAGSPNFAISSSDGSSTTSRFVVDTNGNVGIGTTAPASRLHVPWLSGDTTATALFGGNSSTNNQIAVQGFSYLNTGVFGSSSSGFGVYGQSASSFGIYGTSATDVGVHGEGTTGVRGFGTTNGVLGMGTGTSGTGVQGSAQGATGIAGLFQSSSAIGTAPALVARQFSTSTAHLQEWQSSIGTALDVIDSAGNFGIGTATPNSALHVKGDLTVEGNGGIFTQSMRSDNSSANGLLGTIQSTRSTYDPTGVAASIRFMRGGSSDAGASGALRFATNPGGTTGINPTDRMTIDQNGNVGIGTTAPGTLLANNSGSGAFDSEFHGASSTAINWQASGLGYALALSNSYNGTFANGLVVNTVDTSGTSYLFNLRSSDTDRLAVKGNGNVGIGTSSPSVSLDLGSKTDALRLPNGTTSQEPASPTAGLIRYNTNAGTPPGWVEFYNGSAWVNLVGSSTTGNLSNVGNISGSGAVTISPGGTTQNLNLSNTTGGAVNVTTSAGNIMLQPGGTGSVTVPNATASIGTTSGALVVGGGIGVAGAINAGGAIATSSSISAGTSLIAPALYGSTLASQNLTIDSTSHATKGNVLIAQSGGNVGIGNATPGYLLDVGGDTRASRLFSQQLWLANNYGIQWGNSDSVTGNGISHELDFTTNATTRMTIDTNGNVGIGTTAPDQKLQIESGSSPRLMVTQTSWGHGILERNGTAARLSAVSGSVSQRNIEFGTGDTIGSETIRMLIDGNSGNVGIGTTSPQSNLQVGAWSGTSAGVQIQFPQAPLTSVPPVINSVSNSTNSGGYVGAIGVNIHNNTTGTSGLRTGAFTFSELSPSGAVDSLAAIDAVDNGAGVDGNWRAGALAFHTAQTGGYGIYERMRIDSSGHVGIGTASPLGQLSLGQPGTDAVLRTYPSTDQGIFNFYYAANYPTTNAYNRALDIVAASGSGSAKSIIRFMNQQSTSGGPVEAMRIDQGGNVGIGTTTPSSQLHLYGANQTTPALSTSGALGAGLYLQDSGNNSGNGGAVLFGANQGAFAAIKGNITNGSGSTLGDIAFSTRNAINDGTLTERLRLLANGNVGIGTANPTHTLDVLNSAASSDLSIGPAAANSTTATLYLQGTTAGGSVRTSSISAGNSGSMTYKSANGVHNFVDNVNASSLYIVSGNIGLGTTNPLYQLQLSTDSAAKPGTSSWTVASDIRLKDVRAPFTRSLDALEGIHPIYFNYKKGNALELPSKQEFVGIKAQDAQARVPEAVSVDGKGYLHVTNDAIIWTMLNSIKEVYHRWAGDSADIHRELASLKTENLELRSTAQSVLQENQLLRQRLDMQEKTMNQIKKQLGM